MIGICYKYKKTRLPFIERPFRIDKILDIAILTTLNKLLATHLYVHDETVIIIVLFETFMRIAYPPSYTTNIVTNSF